MGPSTALAEATNTHERLRVERGIVLGVLVEAKGRPLTKSMLDAVIHARRYACPLWESVRMGMVEEKDRLDEALSLLVADKVLHRTLRPRHPLPSPTEPPGGKKGGKKLAYFSLVHPTCAPAAHAEEKEGVETHASAAAVVADAPDPQALMTSRPPKARKLWRRSGAATAIAALLQLREDGGGQGRERGNGRERGGG
ncbi:hypothetical protein Naga_102169g1 [Nannochloropsis gaditana]|uniref:Uncharacterized protein n=1 Tax=Nannochloropsis gaditana TaxID=72520 RepID=W7T1D9_9STRA|nr:hypothetical protein Naga_102169g1 [Nannochloropsis gaditana]